MVSTQTHDADSVTAVQFNNLDTSADHSSVYVESAVVIVMFMCAYKLWRGLNKQVSVRCKFKLIRRGTGQLSAATSSQRIVQFVLSGNAETHVQCDADTAEATREIMNTIDEFIVGNVVYVARDDGDLTRRPAYADGGVVLCSPCVSSRRIYDTAWRQNVRLVAFRDKVDTHMSTCTVTTPLSLTSMPTCDAHRTLLAIEPHASHSERKAVLSQLRDLTDAHNYLLVRATP